MARKKELCDERCRSKGSGTLVLRGAIWHAKWMVNGKLYSRSTKCSDEREAEKKLAEFVKPFQEKTELEVLENLAAKVRVQEHRIDESKLDNSKPVRLDFLIDIYKGDLSSNKIESSTELNYTVRFDALKDVTKKTYAYEVTVEDAAKFLEHVKSRCCETTFNQVLVLMKSAFALAMKKDYRIKENVWNSFSKLKVDHSHTRRELTEDEVSKLMDAAKSITFNKWIHEIFMIGRYTGLRKSDCVSLRWSEIDFENGMIRKLPRKTKKTGKIAIIPLHPALKDMLLSLNREGEYVNAEAMKVKSDVVTDTIKKVFILAGIPTSFKDENGKRHVLTGFHSLRTTFVSECARDGIPLPVIQKMVAHSRVDQTFNYTRTNESDLRLPSFETKCIKLKAETVESLKKISEGKSYDEVIMNLIKFQEEMQKCALCKVSGC